MSRTSLRRQLFYKNLDLLLQNRGLDTVEEESSSRNSEPVTDLDATTETSQCIEAGDSADQGLLYRSPIYRPKHLNNASTVSGSTRPISEYDQCSTPYFEPWESKSSGSGVRPGTPYTEIDIDDENDDDNTALSGNKIEKSKPFPLKFQFPETSDSHSSPSHKRRSFPFSPIHRTTVRAQFRGLEGCKSCDEDVRVLPMSPALLISQSTSTPGPTSSAMETPTCKSILENNNSIFNFSECNMCRICHEDGSKEKLVSPCHCAGTMGMLHVSCLEKWLGSSNTSKCEICQFQFVVQKKPRALKWYFREPSLIDDRNLMIKDLASLIALCACVFVICVPCFLYGSRLAAEGKHGPSAVLVLLAVCAIVLYSVWLIVTVKRMKRRLHFWHNEHHIIQIKQRQGCHNNKSNRIFRRFPVKLSSTRDKSQTKNTVNNNLIPTSYIGCSLESYKAAMFNPVTPNEPLLQDSNNNDITSLDESSPSVISLDELIQECVSYYQPPECGTTSVLNADTGKVLRETGV